MSEHISFNDAMLALNRGKKVKAKVSKYKFYKPIGYFYLNDLMKPNTIFKIVPDVVYLEAGSYSKQQLQDYIKELE